MALSTIYLDIVFRLMIVLVFTLMNAMIIREILVLFGTKDDTMMTSTALSFWLGLTLFASSFFADIKLFGWVIAVLANIFFIYLYRRYYSKDWKESILIWESWLSIMIYISIFIAAFSVQIWTLLFWGMIPVLINLSYVAILKLNLEKRWVNIPSLILGFLSINIIWILLFKTYFPI